MAPLLTGTDVVRLPGPPCGPAGPFTFFPSSLLTLGPFYLPTFSGRSGPAGAGNPGDALLIPLLNGVRGRRLAMRSSSSSPRVWEGA